MTVLFIVLFSACQGPLPGQFACGNRTLDTVPNSQVCDGVVDCWGGQDERGDDCATQVFYCDQSGESQVILLALECDGVNDCDDDFDEANCPVP